jgi:hypothetical protein
VSADPPQQKIKDKKRVRQTGEEPKAPSTLPHVRDSIKMVKYMHTSANVTKPNRLSQVRSIKNQYALSLKGQHTGGDEFNMDLRGDKKREV